MKSRPAILFAIVGASFGLAACGSSGDTTTVTEASPPVKTSEESSSTEKQIEAIERETEEAELEAAEAKKEAAVQAAKAKKAAAKRVAAESAESAQAEEESVSEAPDVIGMRLPEAESTLRSAGFRTQAENTDTAFGIVIRSHYTICTQSEPHGDTVTVLAQKYGC